MIIENGKVEEFFIALRGSWNQGLSNARLWIGDVAKRENSTARTERYWWTEDMGELEEWVGPREFEAIQARTWDVTNVPYQKAYKVDAHDIMDAQINLYSGQALALGRSSALWPQTLVKPWLTTGHQKLCYDGQPFFDESHPVAISDPAMGLYSNYFRNKAFGANAWKDVSKRMKTYKSPAGNFYGLRPTHVFHAADIETEVRQLFNTTYIATAQGLNPAGGTASNVSQGEAIPVMIPELPDGWWVVADMGQALKPFVYQVRQDPVFIAQTDPASQRYFSEHQFAFGVDARGAGTVTMPVLAILCRPD